METTRVQTSVPRVGITDSGLEVLRRYINYPWLPGAVVAAQEFADFKTSISSAEPAPWDESWFKGLQKKYRPPEDKSNLCPLATGIPRQQMGLALSLLPTTIRNQVTSTWMHLHLHTLTNGQLFIAFKTLGDIAKHHGNLLFPGYWTFMIDWNLHFGAQPTEDTDDEFTDLIESWVSTPKPEDAIGSDRDVMIMRGLDRLESDLGRPDTPGQNIDDFLASPSSWLSNGASDSRKLEGTRATKFSTYAASTNAQLHTDMFDPSCPHYRVFDKREKGKHRNLISSPWSLFLQMSFVGQQAESRFKKVVPTSLSNDWTPESWLHIMDMMRTKLFVPIDQSKFDHVPSKRVLLRCAEILCKSGTCPLDPEREMISKLILDRLANATLSYNNNTYSHQRGLLSGWRWTSLMGTMINYAEYLSITDSLAVPRQLKANVCFQGDDALIAVNDWADAVKIVQRYMEVLPVNPSKFFIDNRRSEYLRYVITRNRRLGYYPRAASGIMYANSWAGGAMDPASLASNWSLLYSRGADAKETLYGCARDLCGLLRCNVDEALDLIQTPSSVGGLGWYVPGFQPKTWRRVPFVKRTEIGKDRLVIETDYDNIPKHTRTTMVAAAMQRGHSRPMASIVARSLSTGLVGIASPERPKQRLMSYGRPKVFIASRAHTHHTPRPPQSLLDPLYVNAAVASLDRKGGLRWTDVFRSDDVHWLKARKRNWGMKLFNKWSTGQLSGYAGKRWGDAPDFLAVVRRRVEAEGILPSGHMSMHRVTTRLLELELASRFWLVDTRLRLGA
uniref:RdRp n=1 Tax=viral metagenome TaxID=1070528 RepID=A0A2V0RBI9_9ZZZZ